MTSALLIKCIIGIVGIVIVAPTIMFCFFPQLTRAFFEGGPGAVEKVGPPKGQMLVAQLKEMGFRTLGVKVEKLPFKASVRELSLVSGDGRCYASVLARRHSWLYYYTPFPDGGLVLSSNGPFSRIVSPRVVQRSYPGCEAKELLDHHRTSLSSMGRQVDLTESAESRVEATYAYYRTPEVRGVLRRIGLFYLGCCALLGWLLVR